VWEQSFPAVGGIGLPITDPRTGAMALVRLSRRQAARRGEANEQRLARLLMDWEALGLTPIVLGTSEPDRIDDAFIAWAERRGSGAWAR
jgi:hypothetical protein